VTAILHTALDHLYSTLITSRYNALPASRRFTNASYVETVYCGLSVTYRNSFTHSTLQTVNFIH